MGPGPSINTSVESLWSAHAAYLYEAGSPVHAQSWHRKLRFTQLHSSGRCIDILSVSLHRFVDWGQHNLLTLSLAIRPFSFSSFCLNNHFLENLAFVLLWLYRGLVVLILLTHGVWCAIKPCSVFTGFRQHKQSVRCNLLSLRLQINTLALSELATE